MLYLVFLGNWQPLTGCCDRGPLVMLDFVLLSNWQPLTGCCDRGGLVMLYLVLLGNWHPLTGCCCRGELVMQLEEQLKVPVFWSEGHYLAVWRGLHWQKVERPGGGCPALVPNVQKCHPRSAAAKYCRDLHSRHGAAACGRVPLPALLAHNLHADTLPLHNLLL
jgi:hypothetical protein